MHENRFSKYLLLWCLGIYLRLGVLIVPPLIPRLETLLGFTAEQVAIATSLPILFIALGSLASGWMAKRLGVVLMMSAGLLVVAAGGALRSLPVDFAMLMLFTAVMGGGIALMQVSLPTLVRVWMPDRIGRGTAVYTNGLLMGEVFAAGLTGPLASHVLGNHWRWIFALWMLPAAVLAAVLPGLCHGRTAADARPGADAAVRMRAHWRNPLLWRAGLLLGVSGGLYLSGNVFLPQILLESGRLRLITQGLLALNGMQLVSSVALVLLADRLLGRRWPIAAALILATAMIPAMLRLPGAGPVWAAGVYGFATSCLLTLVLALPPSLASLSELPGLMAGILAVGYTIVFVVPPLGGWAHILTGRVAASFAPAVVLVLASLGLTLRPGALVGRGSQSGFRKVDRKSR